MAGARAREAGLTQNILSAANAVISHNSGRREKNLWTAAGDGAPITGYVADSEHDEARWISQEIEGVPFALMYKSMRRSRVFVGGSFFGSMTTARS